MDNFSLTTQLSQQEYCKLFIQLSYKQRKYQVFTMMSILMIIVSVLRFFMKSILSANVQWILFCISIYFLVLFPIIVWLRAKKIYQSNPGLQAPIKYRFTENGVSLTGSDKTSDFEWKEFGKVQQTKSFLLMYNYNRAAYFIKLKDLTQEQIEFIQSKVETKT